MTGKLKLWAILTMLYLTMASRNTKVAGSIPSCGQVEFFTHLPGIVHFILISNIHDQCVFKNKQTNKQTKTTLPFSKGVLPSRGAGVPRIIIAIFF